MELHPLQDATGFGRREGFVEGSWRCCTGVFDAFREGAISVLANSLRHSGTLMTEMPSSRVLCAISFPLVWVRRTDAHLHSYVEGCGLLV